MLVWKYTNFVMTEQETTKLEGALMNPPPTLTFLKYPIKNMVKITN